MNSKSLALELEATKAELAPYQQKDSFTPEEFEKLEGLLSKHDEQVKQLDRVRSVESNLQLQMRKSQELTRPAAPVPGWPGANLDAERQLLAADPRIGWGVAVTDTEEFKNYRRNPRVPAEFEIESKALITTTGLLVPSYRPGILDLRYPPLLASGLFTITPVDSGSYTYFEETAFTNAANWVAEGAKKPESTKTFAPQTVNVQKIAHFIKVTTEALEDVPQMQAKIENNLRGGLLRRTEVSLINGTGTPPEIRGLLNFAGIQQTPFNTDLITSILDGITAVEAPGYGTVNGILMNPADWNKVRTTQVNGIYYFGLPTQAGTEMLWGKTVVVTPAVAAGYAVVGDFTQAEIIQRKGVTVFSGLELDDLTKNIVTVVCEARLALIVLYPKAFARVDLTAA